MVILVSVVAISCRDAGNYPQGGHSYLKNYQAADTAFYYLPVRDSFSRMDSFLAVEEAVLVYKYFDEPNYSLNPNQHELFRISWSAALGENAFITLTPRSIIVKQSIPGVGYNYYTDENRLTEQEQKDLRFFEYRQPLDYEKQPEQKKRKLDSIFRLRPELQDSRYYRALIKKSVVPREDPKPKYFYRQIPITTENYNKIWSEIHNSRFWQMPVKSDCEASIFDGEGYIVEANTKTRYQVVIFSSCNTSILASDFAKACQRLINMAGLQDEINLHHDYNDTATRMEIPDSFVIPDIKIENIPSQSTGGIKRNNQ